MPAGGPAGAGPVDAVLPLDADRTRCSHPATAAGRDGAGAHAVRQTRVSMTARVSSACWSTTCEENLLALAALLRRDDVEILQARSAPRRSSCCWRTTSRWPSSTCRCRSMDGFELAELMRGSERTRHVPIIFVTAGVARPASALQGLRDAAPSISCYKPIEPHMLKSKARRLLPALSPEAAARATSSRAHRDAAPERAVHRRAGPRPAQSAERDPQVGEAARAQVGEERRAQVAGRRAGRARKRMSRMIEDMLDLARARLGGGIPLRRRALRPRGSVRRVVEERRATAPGHDFALRSPRATSPATGTPTGWPRSRPT